MKITKRQLRRIIREGMFGDRMAEHRYPEQKYQGKTKFKVQVDSLYKMVVIKTIRDGDAMIYADDIDKLIEALQAIKSHAVDLPSRGYRSGHKSKTER